MITSSYQRLFMQACLVAFVFSVILMMVCRRKPDLGVSESLEKPLLYSVSVADKVMALARVSAKDEYEIMYLDPMNHIEICDPVYTTGLDGRQEVGQLIGYVSVCREEPGSRFLKVYVKSSSQCAGFTSS